jgi:hypothetical protein
VPTCIRRDYKQPQTAPAALNDPANASRFGGSQANTGVEEGERC